MAEGTMYQGMRRRRDELDTEKTDAAISNALGRIKNYSALTGRTPEDNAAPQQEVGVAPQAKKPKKNSLGMAEAKAADVPEVQSPTLGKTVKGADPAREGKVEEPPMALGHVQNVPDSMRQIAGASPHTGAAVKDVLPASPMNPVQSDPNNPVQTTPQGVSMQQAGGGYGSITGDAAAIQKQANDPRNYDPNTGKRLPPGVTPNMAYGRLQNAGGSLRVGGMDVSFDDSVSMEQRQAFLQDPVRPTSRGSSAGRLMGDAMPAQGPQGPTLPEMPTLFTKETHPNMRFDEMERLNAELLRGWNAEKTAQISGTLRNEGGANIANISSEGDLAEQQLRNEGVLGAAQMRGGTADEWDMETVSGGTDAKGRKLPDQAFMVSKSGKKVPVNTKFKFLSPEFNPWNLNEQDAGIIKQLETTNPELLDEVFQEYGIAPKEKKGLLSWLFN